MPIYHSGFKQSDIPEIHSTRKQIILETAFLRHPKTVYLMYAMAFIQKYGQSRWSEKYSLY